MGSGLRFATVKGNRGQAFVLTILDRSPVGTFHGHFTGRYHIEIILHFSPGEGISASQRQLSLDKVVPASLAFLHLSQFVPDAGMCQHSFG